MLPDRRHERAVGTLDEPIWSERLLLGEEGGVALRIFTSILVFEVRGQSGLHAASPKESLITLCH